MPEKIKKQHYVPKVYLRNFSFDKKNNEYFVYCFNKTCLRSFPGNISNVAYECYFNDIEGDDDQVIEHLLGKFEGAYAGVFNKIIRNQNLNCLNLDDKTTLAFFFAIQFYRTKEQRVSFQAVFNYIKERLTRQCTSESLREDLDACCQESALKESHLITLMDAVPEMVQQLLTMKWILCKNTTTMPYWTSDNPVVMDNFADNKYERYLGYNCPGIEMYLPLNSKYCLTICDPEKYHVMPDFMETNSVQNVIFNNSLQLMYSTRLIFSDIADFSYAEKFLGERPDYKNINRQRVFPQ